jgi:hypothetical protein
MPVIWMNHMPERETIGQALYTWSLRTHRDTVGYGFAAASPSAEPLLDRIERVTDAINYFPIASGDTAPAAAVTGRQVIGRIPLGESALLVSKTYQGVDANGRPGRYCNQILIGRADTLALSAVGRLRTDRLLPPSASSLSGSKSPKVQDLSPTAILDEPASTYRWAEVEGLIARLDNTGWRSMTVTEDELPGLISLVVMLGPQWDKGSTLVPTLLGTDLRWRLTLSATSDRVATTTHLVADDEWRTAQSRLSGALTSADLASKWGSGRAATGNQDGNLVLENAFFDYTEGDGLQLSQLLENAPERESMAYRIATDLHTMGYRLTVRGPGVDAVNAKLLSAISVTTEGVRLIDDLLPADRHDLARVARTKLTPQVFATVCRRNHLASDRDLIRLSQPIVEPNLWGSINEAWGVNAESRRAAIRTLHASGPDPSGIVGALLDLETPAPYDFLFDELIPNTFNPAEAGRLLEQVEDSFLEWSGLSPFYLETLRRGGGLLGWFRRRRGQD